jgi:hypothetical protein
MLVSYVSGTAYPENETDKATNFREFKSKFLNGFVPLIGGSVGVVK